MSPSDLTATNGLDVQGTSVNQSLSNNLLPNLSDPFYDPDTYTDIWDKIKSWFSNLGSGITSFADAFGNTHPDSIFNIGKDPITHPEVKGSFYEKLYDKLLPENSIKKYDSNSYLSDVDLPDWVSDLFNKAIDMFYDNLNRQYTFNSEEAMKDRLWQEYMSNTSYQRAMADLKAAGINPLVAFGGMSGASTPGGSSASGSLGNSNSLFGSIVNAAMGDKKILASLITAIIGIFKVFSGKSAISSNVSSNNRSIVDFFKH